MAYSKPEVMQKIPMEGMGNMSKGKKMGAKKMPQMSVDEAMTKQAMADKNKSTEDKKTEDAIWSKESEILKQIKEEYTFADSFIRPKWDKWLVRLKLYNNQKKASDVLGDPLLFTIHQTVLASLYSDQLVVEFQGRTRGDDDQAENQTILAQYDCEEMEKERIDYDWDWDTLFFGRGLLLFMEFDRDTMTPMPEVIDPLSFFRDPDAVSVNGDRRERGAARFMGREIRLTKRELEVAGIYKNVDLLDKADDVGTTSVEQNRQARRLAQGYDTLRQNLCGDNKSYVVHEWMSWWNGERYLFTAGKKMGQLIRCQKIRTKKWPVIDRTIYATSHDWDGVSIPDLVEDKQRARAILQNLSLKGVKANLYPNYLYNNLLIKNKASIAKFEFNKFTGVPGSPGGSVVPIERKPVSSEVGWMMNVADAAAQKATATPDIQQGAMTEKVKSATEIAKVGQGVDTRYSLAAKLFGWSEKRFWKLWLELYSIYFKKGIDTKVARIAGALGPQWREITRDNLIGAADPDVFIESKTLSDAKRMNKLNMYSVAMNQAVAMDPNAGKRFMLKQMFKAAGFTSDEINRALPKTFDEYEAEEENKLLDANKIPKISFKQNHQVHIEMHTKAADTEAKKVHIAMHQVALYKMRNNPEMAPQNPAGGGNGEPPAPMTTGATPAPRDMAQSQLQLQASAPQQSMG